MYRRIVCYYWLSPGVVPPLKTVRDVKDISAIANAALNLDSYR